MENANIYTHSQSVNKIKRIKNMNQKPFVLWFTGLSASGKSTLANLIEEELNILGYKTYMIDGDNLRNGLNSDLGFDDNDRHENIRRISHLSSILIQAGVITIVAAISPFKKDREFARSLVDKDEFIEIFVDTSIKICEKRDTKGLYKKAKEGKIKNFTGISSPYERPTKPEIVILNEFSIKKSVYEIRLLLTKKKLIKK